FFISESAASSFAFAVCIASIIAIRSFLSFKITSLTSAVITLFFWRGLCISLPVLFPYGVPATAVIVQRH
ncbi:hypothetical protein ACX3AX_004057, partial [Escherichia coli]